MKVQFRGTRREIRLDQINTDYSYQRKLDMSFVRKLAEEFDPLRFGVPHVSKRHDATHWVVDGNHRLHAVRLLGEKWADTLIPCIVYEGLSLADEAALFSGLNRFHAVKNFDVFRADLMAGDATAKAIATIAETHGFGLDRGGAAGFSCVRVLKRIVGGIKTSANGRGATNLGRVMSVISRAYGTTSPLPSGVVVEGIGLVVEKHGDNVDLERLSRKLRLRPGGHERLHADARQKAKSEQGSVAVAAAELVIMSYNSGARRNLLGSIREARN